MKKNAIFPRDTGQPGDGPIILPAFGLGLQPGAISCKNHAHFRGQDINGSGPPCLGDPRFYRVEIILCAEPRVHLDKGNGYGLAHAALSSKGSSLPCRSSAARSS